MTGEPDLRGPLATIASQGAVALALLYASLRAYWALGGQTLRDSVGVTEHVLSDPWLSPWGLVVAAVVAALLPLGLARRWRALQVPAWIVVLVLALRGFSGLLLLYPLRDLVPPMSGAADLALAVYSPVFLLWAFLLGTVAVLARTDAANER
ncbi:hypothetical protein [Allokutzneria oryzae]|uniref:DUF3995 domain-containing protein n=1 Tax=Allokutzneria oryzae TaxID=1378989 RepID=A0ABV6A691_9PSEU